MASRWTLLFALLGLGPIACVRLNRTGLVRDAGADATPSHDARGEPATDLPAKPSLDTAASAEVGDGAGPQVDTMSAECTPREIGCADERTIRTCNDQGRWVTTSTCAANTACSAGVCLCPGACADDPIAETPTAGLLGDLVGGGHFLYLAVNGGQASIRRFDLSNQSESQVKSAGLEVAVFAVDSDPMGNLLWCSEIVSGGVHTGQLVYGTQQLDTGACTHVRRHDNFAYFKGDVLYRKTFDPSAIRETVSREPMQSFEIAGDDLYFVGELNQEAFLKRISLSDMNKVETLARRPDAGFLRLLPDAAHVYLISEGQILRVARQPGAQLETFWQEPGPEAWDLAQTESHLYWSATTPSGAGCGEAQVLRRSKAGGPVVALARAPGYCAGPLVRIDDHLYTAVSKGPPNPAPTRILRIRL